MSYLGNYVGISVPVGVLTPLNNAIIVGNGTDWVVKTGDLARTALGLGSGDTVTFDTLDVTSKITKEGSIYMHSQGTDSIHVGLNAGNETSPGNANNTSLGVNAFQAVVGATNCTSLGKDALKSMADGANSTAVGHQALMMNTGSGNVALGASAGKTYSNMTDCIFIGRDADATADGLFNAMAIGPGATVSTSNTMVIGASGSPVNVGIGTTNVTHRLTVNGQIRAEGQYNIGSVRVVSARMGGWTAATGDASRSTFVTSTVTTAELAQRVKALIDDLIAHGLIGT